MTHACRALLIAAPASGQGKTTLTAALARQARARGERVRVFKTGPDFLDPTILAQASGAPVYQLDLFMGGEAHCRALLAQAAREVDLILVEGVMGLFDGAPSSADLAHRFGLPVLAVIDGSAMAQTFAALAYGLRHFRADLEFAGVIANRLGSERHAKMLFEALPADIPALGWMPRDAEIALPERHLGLLPASELADLDGRLDKAAAALRLMGDVLPSRGPDGPPSPIALSPNPALRAPRSALHSRPAAQADSMLSEIPARPASGRGELQAALTTVKPEGTAARVLNDTEVRHGEALKGKTIAIARDEAFAFIYHANLDTLHALGAECVFFSPLHDAALPACDAVWLPGGYPELHAAKLAGNEEMRNALRAHHAAGKPLLAECGGMMSLFAHIELSDGTRHDGLGMLPGSTRMQKRFAALGMQEVVLPEGTLRGHSFHYSTHETPLQPIARGTNPNDGPTREAVYRERRLTASYIHFYFPSNPIAVAALFSA